MIYMGIIVFMGTLHGFRGHIIRFSVLGHFRDIGPNSGGPNEKNI